MGVGCYTTGQQLLTATVIRKGWVGMKNLAFYRGISLQTQCHFGPWSGFLYYDLAAPQQEGSAISHLVITQGQPWRPPVPRVLKLRFVSVYNWTFCPYYTGSSQVRVNILQILIDLSLLSVSDKFTLIILN